MAKSTDKVGELTDYDLERLARAVGVLRLPSHMRGLRADYLRWSCVTNAEGGVAVGASGCGAV